VPTMLVGAKADDVEDFLANVDAGRGEGGVVVSMGCFSVGCLVVFADLSRGGCDRCILLADDAQAGRSVHFRWEGGVLVSDGFRSCFA